MAKNKHDDELKEFQRTQQNQYEPWKYVGSDMHPYRESSHKPILSAIWCFFGFSFISIFLLVLVKDVSNLWSLLGIAPLLLLVLFAGIGYVRKAIAIKKQKKRAHSNKANRRKKRK